MQLYYKAAALVSMREWVTNLDTRVLKIEGHDLLLGWHAFIWYRKDKNHSYFKNHCVRKALITVWNSVKPLIYENTPIWVSPVEAFSHPHTMRADKLIRYEDILDTQGELRPMQVIVSPNYRQDWWTRVLLQSRYTKDLKKTGFYKEYGKFDEILFGPTDQLIRKFYNYLLEIKMSDETMKECMVKWACNLGRNIDLDIWEQI